ncbi:MAG: sigma-70 family RNA polymerase sigma factor [Muribaculaceae bacterium]|nr:sigma-70 family RNA polymerase sigma factor [Muribaculaceae bacterium]
MKTLAKMSDEQLVKLYVEGVNEAFDTLIERHKNRVYSYILGAVKNDEVADDVFQDTFIKAIVTIKQGRYTENGHFAAWVTRIAHNLVIDHFRQVKSENLQSTDNADYNILNKKELCDSNIEDSLVLQQINNDLHRLILALPHNQREVLLLRYYRNMSFKEIAERTQVSINTALGRMRYAIMNMRRMAEENHIALTVS